MTSAAIDRLQHTGTKNSAADVALNANVANRILADIQALAPEIAARVIEIEAGRRVPLDLVEKLRSISVFRALTPRSHGGLELDMPAAIAIMEALCRIDGSVGWVSIIGLGTAIFAPLVPREIYDQIYAKGPDVIFASSIQAAGTAEAVDGGWRVNGRWPFASGCQHAEWIFGQCVMSKDGKPLPASAGDSGARMIRCFVLQAREWQVEDTWYAMGLRGSGSHHVSLKDKLIPEANFFDLTNESCVPGPLYQALMQFIPLMHFPAATGIAAAALAELVQLANTGRQQQRTTAPMRDLETFQYELGRIEADLRAVRAFAATQIEGHWRHALAGTLKDDTLITQGAQAATWITSTCIRIVDECFRLGGGSALYDSSPLQRRMRDLHTAAQHAAVHHRTYIGAGKLVLGNSSADVGVRV
jgi:indole-3-acetate monooxygenase